jgi:hypothetical protein
MNLYNVGQNGLQHLIGSLFSHLFKVLGFIIFWVFMFALLTCPSWLPPLLDKIH